MECELTINLWLKSSLDQKNDYAWLMWKSTFENAPYYITDEGNGDGFWRVNNPDDNRSIVGLDIRYDQWKMLSQTWSNDTTYHIGYTDANLTANTTFDHDRLVDNDYSLRILRDGKVPYLGKIDEARIYNRSLPEREFERLYSVRSEDWAVDGCKLTG